MTKAKSTKRNLTMSVLALVMCFAMLIGTTYAWFTDSVTSSGNIIKSGTLDVEMEWANGKEAPANATWTDASEGAIFNNDLWEPGYTEARHIKISNKGTLALKWDLAIVPNGEVSELGDVIDVYYYDGHGYGTAKQVADRNSLNGFEYMGSLNDWLSTGFADGFLDAGKDYSVTIVLKMNEEAGNEYQNLAIGADFAVKLNATQYTKESDSFDYKYDIAASKTIATPETIQDVIHAAQPGDVIYLENGNYGNLVIENADGTPKKGITIEHDKPQTSYTEPLTVAAINLNASEDITIRGIFFAADQAERVYGKNGASDYYASITGSKAGGNNGAKNIVIDNCRFKNDGAYWDESTVNPNNYVPVCFEEQGRPTSRATNITVMNCYVDIEVFNFVRMNYMADGTIIIKNNSIPVYATRHNVMNFTGNAADLKIRENYFRGWNPEKSMLGTSRQGTNKINIEVTGNTFNPRTALTDEGRVLDLKSTYTVDNCKVNFSGNTFDGALAGMTESTAPCNLPN